VEKPDAAVQALMRAYVACRLAVDALPDLPEQVRSAVETPVTELCRTVEPALKRIDPDLVTD
jgi:actin-like ATPase involved in cell morphogenesis